MTEPSLPEEPIFAQALEIDSPTERAAFLDRACGQNPVLRADVEALLGAHGRAGDLLDLLDKPAVTVAEPITERPGTIIGPTSSCSKSAKAEWVSSSWPSRPSRCGEKSL